MAKLKADTYDGLCNIVPRVGMTKVIGNNTTAERTAANVITVSLHGHRIVILEESGRRTLFSLAGWNTVTTRERINQFLPGGARVSTKDGVPFLVTRQRTVLGEPLPDHREEVSSSAWVMVGFSGLVLDHNVDIWAGVGSRSYEN